MRLELQPKTFVIALKDHDISQSQLQDCLNSASEFEWNIVVFWAVDGRTVTEETWSEIGLVLRTDKPTTHKPGVQGCFLSHYALWNKCIELNEPIVILEHDAVITGKWVPLDIGDEVIKLHVYYKRSNIKTDEHAGIWSPSAHAYCITPKHANVLIDFVKKIGAFEVDRILGTKVIGVIHSDSKSLVDRQNTFSTTSKLKVK